MDPTLDNVEYLHQHGSITQEAYSLIVANLLQVEQAPPPPSKGLPPAPYLPPGAGPSHAPPPPLQIPSRASSSTAPEPYIVDVPASAAERGSKNQAVYDFLNEDRVGDVLNQLLKIHPFMRKRDRKALVHAVRTPLVKGVAAATSPDKQAAFRRSTSSAFKGMKPSTSTKKESTSAAEAMANREDSFEGAEIVTDDDGGDPRFIKTMSSSLDIAPGLRLDVDTIVRVVLDPEVLLNDAEEKGLTS